MFIKYLPESKKIKNTFSSPWNLSRLGLLGANLHVYTTGFAFMLALNRIKCGVMFIAKFCHDSRVHPLERQIYQTGRNVVTSRKIDGSYLLHCCHICLVAFAVFLQIQKPQSFLNTRNRCLQSSHPRTIRLVFSKIVLLEQLQNNTILTNMGLCSQHLEMHCSSSMLSWHYERESQYFHTWLQSQSQYETNIHDGSLPALFQWKYKVWNKLGEREAKL